MNEEITRGNNAWPIQIRVLLAFHVLLLVIRSAGYRFVRQVE